MRLPRALMLASMSNAGADASRQCSISSQRCARHHDASIQPAACWLCRSFSKAEACRADGWWLPYLKEVLLVLHAAGLP